MNTHFIIMVVITFIIHQAPPTLNNNPMNNQVNVEEPHQYEVDKNDQTSVNGTNPTESIIDIFDFYDLIRFMFYRTVWELLVAFLKKISEFEMKKTSDTKNEKCETDSFG